MLLSLLLVSSEGLNWILKIQLNKLFKTHKDAKKFKVKRWEKYVWNTNQSKLE